MNITDKTIFNILARSIGTALLLISSIVMARYLSKEDLGTFFQVMLIVNTGVMLSCFGLPQSIFYFYHHIGNKKQFLTEVLLLAALLSLLCALVLQVIADIIVHSLNNIQLKNYLVYATAILFCRGMSQFREPILLSANRILLNSFMIILFDTFFYLPTIVGVVFGFFLEDIFLLMAASSVLEMIVFLFILLYLFRRDSLVTENNLSDSNVTLIDLAKYSIPIGFSSYLGILSKRVDQYLISIFFTPASFAVYSRGALVVPVLNDFQFTVNSILMPQYVKLLNNGNIQSFLDIFKRSIKSVAKVKFPAFCFLCAVAHELVIFLYTSQYEGAVPVLRVYLVLLLLTITVYATVPRASGKTLSITYSVIIAIPVNIVVSIYLIHIFGPVGAATGTILSGIAASLVLLLSSCRILQTSLKEIFPWSYLGNLFLVSCLPSVPIYMLSYYIAFEEELHLFFFLIFSGISYFYLWSVLMMRFRLFNKDDLDTLSRWTRIDMHAWLPRLTFSRPIEWGKSKPVC